MNDLINQKYEILGELGQGGMGKVYLARQVSVNREVALKVLPRELTATSDFLARFMREVEVIAELQHARIIPVYDYGEMDGQPFVALALMPGGSLAGRLAAGPIPLKEAVPVIDQIAEALDYVHERGIVHRDLKPGNILLDNSGNAFLADFGIARVVEATAQITGTGILGTPPFMAPELFMTSDATPASDIYALGVTLFQLLTDRYPFEGNTPAQQMMGHLEKPVPSLLEIMPALPAEVDMVLATAMAKDPAERYATAGAMASALRQAAHSKPAQIAIPASDVPAPRRVSRLSLIIGAVVGLTLVIAFAAYLIVNAGRDPQVSEAETPTSEPTEVSTDAPTPTATRTPQSTNVASSALNAIPTATPEPRLGGGSGLLSFYGDFPYQIDADCVVNQRSGCNPIPILDEDSIWHCGDAENQVAATELDIYYSMLVYDEHAEQCVLISDDATRFPQAWSPNRDQIAYLGTGGVYFASSLACVEQHDVYCTGSSTLLFEEDSLEIEHLAWSPGMQALAYVSQRRTEVGGYLMYLSVYEVAAQRIIPVTFDFSVQRMEWIDDSHLLYVDDSDLKARKDVLKIASLDSGTAMSMLLMPPGGYGLIDFAISPDRRYVAFSAYPLTGQDTTMQIFVADLACMEAGIETCPTTIQQVTADGLQKRGLAWSHSSEILAYVGYEPIVEDRDMIPCYNNTQIVCFLMTSSNVDLQLVNIGDFLSGEAAVIRAIPSPGIVDSMPTWSPDDQYVAFVGINSSTNVPDVFIADAATVLSGSPSNPVTQVTTQAVLNIELSTYFLDRIVYEKYFRGSNWWNDAWGSLPIILWK